MTVRTVIIDDEAPARRRMKKLLKATASHELVGEAESGRQAIEVINDKKPDLVLLDIELKDITGFDVIRFVNAQKINIVFITAYDTYAIQAFEENAIDYLLKPYKDDRFYEALERAKERYTRNTEIAILDLIHKFSKGDVHSGKIQVPEGKTMHYMEEDKIDFVQANSYYCNFHLEGEKMRIIRISLKSLETILPKNFVRVNKSMIVNKNKIKSIRHLKNTIEIELANQKFTFYNNDDNFEKLRHH